MHFKQDSRAKPCERPPLVEASRVCAVARSEMRQLRQTPGPLVVLIIMPMLLVVLLEDAYRDFGQAHSPEGVSGLALVVPGMTVTFAFSLMLTVGLAIFREHAWHTWDRLRASPITGAEIALGKAVTPLAQASAQFALLFGLGVLVLGMQVRGSLAALAMVGGAFSLWLVSTGLALAALCRTVGQFTAVSRIAAVVLAGLGGALVPLSTLPSWVQVIAPLDPAHWAIRGYEDVILGGTIGTVLPDVLALAGLSILLFIVAAKRFGFTETKGFWG